jgi:hypothetical protein
LPSASTRQYRSGCDEESERWSAARTAIAETFLRCKDGSMSAGVDMREWHIALHEAVGPGALDDLLSTNRFARSSNGPHGVRRLAEGRGGIVAL